MQHIPIFYLYPLSWRQRENQSERRKKFPLLLAIMVQWLRYLLAWYHLKQVNPAQLVCDRSKSSHLWSFHHRGEVESSYEHRKCKQNLFNGFSSATKKYCFLWEKNQYKCKTNKWIIHGLFEFVINILVYNGKVSCVTLYFRCRTHTDTPKIHYFWRIRHAPADIYEKSE